MTARARIVKMGLFATQVMFAEGMFVRTGQLLALVVGRALAGAPQEASSFRQMQECSQNRSFKDWNI